jgi:hypothetical protein
VSTCDTGIATGIKAIGCQWAFVSVTENFFGTWNWETNTPDRVASGNICEQENGSVWPLIKYDWSCSYTTEKDCTSKFVFYETEIPNYYYIQDQRKA